MGACDAPASVAAGICKALGRVKGTAAVDDTPEAAAGLQALFPSGAGLSPSADVPVSDAALGEDLIQAVKVCICNYPQVKHL